MFILNYYFITTQICNRVIISDNNHNINNHKLKLVNNIKTFKTIYHNYISSITTSTIEVFVNDYRHKHYM